MQKASCVSHRLQNLRICITQNTLYEIRWLLKIHEWLFVCYLITCIQTMIRYFIQIYVTKHYDDDYTSAVITL
jgi:hypothetical protein